MKYLSTIIFIVLSYYLYSQSKDSVTIKLMNNGPVELYSRTEIGIKLPRSIETSILNFVSKKPQDDKINPFLEWEIRVETVYETPEGQELTMDAFYFESFDSKMKNFYPPKNGIGYSDDEYRNMGQYIKKEGEFMFRSRIAPNTEGEWKCRVNVYRADSVISSDQIKFNVKSSEREGFLTTGENGRFLERDGRSFYPVGCNMPWPQTSDKLDPDLFDKMKGRLWNGKIEALTEAYKSVYVLPRVYDKYRAYMKEYAEGGMNSFRTIMYPTGTEIEWEELGDYSKRMTQAYELDRILALAEQEDVVLFWNLQIHYTFQYAQHAYGANWTWDRTMNGYDFCYKSLLKSDDPLEFFSNEEAKKYYKQRLRYILSRWGYSANIGVFELFSEISNVGTKEADHNDYYRTDDHWRLYRDWQLEMAEYIKSKYNGQIHLLTGSFAGEKIERDDVYESEFMDIMSSNIYNFGTSSGAQFWIDKLAKRQLNENGESGNSYTLPGGDPNRINIKPLIYSETDPVMMEVKCDSFTVEFDRSLWQSTFSGLAGSLSWMQWVKLGSTDTYKKIDEFISPLQLDADKWHPGASALESDKNGWAFSERYASRMSGWVKPGLLKKRRLRKADLIYLRRGDGMEATGVISNLTWNIYTTSDCYDKDYEASFDFERRMRSGLTELQDVQLKREKLCVLGLKKGKYKIQFYSPEDLSKVIFEENFKGSKYKFKRNELGTETKSAMILFRILPLAE